MPCKVHFKDFAKISHENILFLIRENYMTAAYLFLDFNHILLCQITFSAQWVRYLRVVKKLLCYFYCLKQPL